MKLSDYVIKKISDIGVKHVFMLAGGGAMHLNDSLGRSKYLQHVCNLHEQACAIAAESYGQYTNNLGVCMVPTGPGSTRRPSRPRPRPRRRARPRGGGGAGGGGDRCG
mgnify:CR=1 FL=1